MAAPTKTCDVKKGLGKTGPSTHGTYETSSRRSELPAIEGTADLGATTPQPANDPA